MEPDKNIHDELRDLMGPEFGSLVRMFVRNTDSLLERLAANPRAEQSPQDFAREVHALKSSCRYMGAEHLGDAAEKLEMSVRARLAERGEAAEIERCLETLRQSWHAARPAFETMQKSAGAA
jgi:HPt (histidine-containing phosphotransfer) domain-containing protein